MITRALEQNDVLRASVATAEVLSVDKTAVVLRAQAVVQQKKKSSSASPGMFDLKRLSQVGDRVEGRIRIDVLTDEIVRVRYAEGEEIPENRTPMLVDMLPAGPTRCTITRKKGEVQITTGSCRITVSLDPYRLEVHDSAGRKLCGVGGPETDNFCEWDAYNTGVCRARVDDSPLAVECFDLAPGEGIYGLGEKFLSLNKVGQTVDLELTDARGVATPRSYKSVPFFVSTRGYGVFFNHSSLMTYWVGSMSATDITVTAADDFLDYFIITGNIKEVLARYTDLTGKGSLPPKWTFGYWQSKISYHSADEVLELARTLREYEIPCDVICLDTHWYEHDWFCNLEFDKTRFPDPRACLQELAQLGIKVSLWQLPYILEGSQLFDDLKAVDGFVKTSDGEIFNVGICFVDGFKGIVGVVDFTNPAAVRVHQEAFRKLFRLGAKAIKTDFGEEAPLNGVYFDGTPGHRMKNLYPLLYNRAIFSVTREETGGGVVWGRSAWAGSQRYPLHWGGDSSPYLNNIIPQLAGGLSFGMSGFQFWSQDIGGFLGETNDHLLIRWMQFGLFLSHSRVHGMGDRELYKFAPETVRICRDYIRLRYQLLPYLYGSAQRCVADSLPMARALVVEYQDDPTTYHIGDEYLLGDSLLVAPIYTEENRRRIYLPAGQWTNWWTKERIAGGRWIEVEAALDILPLYIREGGIIPMGPAMNYVDEKPVEKIRLLVAPFAADGQSKFVIPVNDETIPVTYTAKNGRHTLEIGPAKVEIEVETLGGKAVTVIKK